MSTEKINSEFNTWVQEQTGKNPSQLHELVRACLEDAIEQLHKDKSLADDAGDPVKKKENMKQILDYWGSNVYMIIERGIASDAFRGLRMPIPNDAKARALKDFYAVRNASYARYFE